MPITVKPLEVKDILELAAAFLPTVWKTPAAYFQKILGEQEKEQRVVLVAYYEGKIAGFINILWQSGYPPFAEKGIPEINDLRVLEEYRRKGVATALVDEAEKRIFKRSPVVGIGVGLYADYGPAQQMYTRRGYNLDGRGLISNNEPVKPGNHVFVDDDLVIFLTKERP